MFYICGKSWSTVDCTEIVVSKSPTIIVEVEVSVFNLEIYYPYLN